MIYMDELEINSNNSNESAGDNCVNTDRTPLEVIQDNLKYVLFQNVLVKPLPEILVTKTITSMIPKDEKSPNGEIEYDTKSECKEVPSIYREGVVLSLPTSIMNTNSNAPMVEYGFKPGDTVIYRQNSSMDFDIFKDSVLIRPYDIIGKVK